MFLFAEAATDPSLDQEDWSLNMEICDMINESSSDVNCKDAMKAIRKRLTQYVGKNYSVILWVKINSRLINWCWHFDIFRILKSL